MNKEPDVRTLPRLSPGETAAVILAVGGPLFTKGIIVRRPWVVGLLQATGLERSAVATLQAINRRHGVGPVLLRLPFREQAVILSAAHAARVLDETPHPFQTDSSEKHATLAHFQPNGSLISRGEARAERRAFSDGVLQSACPMHQLAGRFRQVVHEEVATLLNAAQRSGALAWGTFKDGWFRIVRRCLFGDRAAEDTDLTALLVKLRGDANWAFLKPDRTVLRARFLSRLASELHRPESGTLAALAPRMATRRSAPADQVAQWLFAFDAAGIATFRALAMLASEPTLTTRARQDRTPELPFLRACVLDTVRLWPTTPAILRQTDRETSWDGAIMPAGTSVLIHVPFLHRDDERLPFAHAFSLDLWLSGAATQWGLIPFSGGPGECPAKDLVLLLASTTLSVLVEGHAFRMPPGRILDPANLPATFDHFSLTLGVEEIAAA